MSSKKLRRLKKLGVPARMDELERLTARGCSPGEALDALLRGRSIRSRHRLTAQVLVEELQDYIRRTMLDVSPEEEHVGVRTLAERLALWHRLGASDPAARPVLLYAVEGYQSAYDPQEGLSGWASEFSHGMLTAVEESPELVKEYLPINAALLSVYQDQLSLDTRCSLQGDRIRMLGMDGDIAGAEALFREVTAALPEHPIAWVRWAEVVADPARGRGDIAAAMEIIREGQGHLPRGKDDWGLAWVMKELQGRQQREGTTS